MIKKTVILSLFICTVLSSCTSSSRVVYSWVNSENAESRDHKKIFVIALTENNSAQIVVENSFLDPLKSVGLEVVTANQIFQKTFTKNSLLDKSEILKKANELNCDLIFLISLIDAQSETRYVPGSYSHAPYPRFGYYGMFGSYYGYWSGVVYEPGYYTTQNSYFLEGNLYDSANESIMWSIQSKTYNPRDIKSFSREYSILVVNQAIKDGVIKKKK